MLHQEPSNWRYKNYLCKNNSHWFDCLPEAVLGEQLPEELDKEQDNQQMNTRTQREDKIYAFLNISYAP